MADFPFVADVFELNKRLSAENDALKERIKALEEQLDSTKRTFDEKITELTNTAVDGEFERGIFVEEDVLKKLERENAELRQTLEEFYKKTLKEWYDEVRDIYRC